jgi:hypothetical protein
LARLFGDIEGRKLLQDVLLPYAANASNFVIGRSTPEKCAHGSHLAKWLGAVLNAGDAEAKKATALAVLEWVDEKEDNLFAPARAWILQGVLKGVEGEKVFAETRDLELLVKIAKMRRLWVIPFAVPRRAMLTEVKHENEVRCLCGHRLEDSIGG